MFSCLPGRSAAYASLCQITTASAPVPTSASASAWYFARSVIVVEGVAKAVGVSGESLTPSLPSSPSWNYWWRRVMTSLDVR